ncbi:MAG: pur operon repressor [Christensenellales bacterium]|jgi:purine operon repressor
MERTKRSERIGVIARILTSSPNRIHTLGEFCELFGSAKSTISEDIDLLKTSLARFGQGEVQTIAGAAGGVRYRATLPEKKVREVLQRLASRLSDPARLLTGGFLYTSDITSEPDTCEMLGRIIAMRNYERQPQFVLTMETKGIPLALMTAKMLDVPLVIARRDTGAYEGSAVKINYSTGSNAMKTMTLSMRAVKPGQRALIVDDFMKGGGTLQGMASLMREMRAEVVGSNVLISTREPEVKRVKDVRALLLLETADMENNRVKVVPAE